MTGSDWEAVPVGRGVLDDTDAWVCVAAVVGACGWVVAGRPARKRTIAVPTAVAAAAVAAAAISAERPRARRRSGRAYSGLACNAVPGGGRRALVLGACADRAVCVWRSTTATPGATSGWPGVLACAGPGLVSAARKAGTEGLSAGDLARQPVISSRRSSSATP